MTQEEQEKHQKELSTLRAQLVAAVWFLPLFGMHMAGYDPEIPDHRGKIFVCWLLGVPLAIYVYYKLRAKNGQSGG